MHCQYCGHEHPDELKFCPRTGKQLEQAGKICAKCSASIPAEAGFCPVCGSAFVKLSVDKRSVSAVPQNQGSPSAITAGQARSSSKSIFFFLFLLLVGMCLLATGAWALFDFPIPSRSTTDELAATTGPVGDIVEQLPSSSSSTLLSTLETILPSMAVPGSSTSTLASSISQPTHTQPAATLVPSQTPTPERPKIAESDGMEFVYVPAGEFLRGLSQSDQNQIEQLCPSCTKEDMMDQFPQRSLALDGFWIDKTEVTNAQFAHFVEQSGYITSAEQRGISSVYQIASGVFQDVTGADWQHPTGPDSNIQGKENVAVTQVSWLDANSYCLWAGRRLPSEAEWEKAARGDDGRLFPWGNQAPSKEFLNFDLANSGPVAVGGFPAGASPYGVLDMVGNVWEWVADSFEENYYASAPALNPKGPAASDRHTMRGGSWASRSQGYLSYVTTTFRLWNYASVRSDVTGFRCALSDPESVAAPPNTPTPTTGVAIQPTNTAAIAPSVGYSNWIVFAKGYDVDRELFLLNPETGETIQLTFNQYQDEAPSFSPGSTKIVFTSYRPPNGWKLYIYDLEQNIEWPITGDLETFDGSPRFPSWSPVLGDDRIVFQDVRGDFGSRTTALWLVRQDGSNLQQLTFFGADSQAVWSPDSRYLLFGRALQDTTLDGRVSVSDNLDLHILELESNNIYKITDTPGYDDFSYSWSPDGEWLVFCSVRRDASGNGVQNLDDSRDLFLIRPTGQGEKRIDLGNKLTFDPKWSPDGRKILFGVKLGEGEHQLWLLDVITESISQLIGTGPFYHAEWGR